MKRPAVVVLMALTFAACSSEGSPEPAPPSPSTTETSESPTVSESPTPSEVADPGVDRLVIPPAAASLPDPWREKFVIPYGPGKALLGTSPGGDSGTLNYGPEYGAPDPDGTWWFLDYAKGRLAHYDADGHYLDRTKIDRNLLVSGRYYHWQLPHVLADGTLIAVRLDPPDSYLLRIRDGAADEVRVRGMFTPKSDDGTLLYGSLGRGKYVVVDPTDGSRERTETFRTPTGARYFVGNGFDNGRLRVELPDAGVSKAVPVRTASGAMAHVGSEVVAGADGTIHVYLVGVGEDDESLQLVGYTSISPSGTVSAVEGMPDPFSDSDPGSPAHLVMAPGSSTPMLVYVLEDGVHVYERSRS